VGFSLEAAKFFLFYLFTTFANCVFTFTGQMLMSLFRDAQAAQGLGAIIVTCTSLFSGVLINPAEIPAFWIWLYWILAGHWIFEGIFMSQYEGDDTPIEASVGTAFYQSLNCTSANESCIGTAEEWINVKFPTWSPSNIKVSLEYPSFRIRLFVPSKSFFDRRRPFLLFTPTVRCRLPGFRRRRREGHRVVGDHEAELPRHLRGKNGKAECCCSSIRRCLRVTGSLPLIYKHI